MKKTRKNMFLNIFVLTVSEQFLMIFIGFNDFFHLPYIFFGMGTYFFNTWSLWLYQEMFLIKFGFWPFRGGGSIWKFTAGDFAPEAVLPPPLFKMQILKIQLFHVRKGPNIGPEPNFHDPITSNGWDYPGQPKMGRILTLRVMGSPP